MSEPDGLVVRVKEGQIQGIKQRSPVFLCDYYSFYGVPYAQPPINDLRFKDPVKVSPWKGVRNATIPRDACVQLSPIHGRMMGSENCLHVNIYTPELRREGNPPKAVLAFLHPGSLLWGSPNPTDHGSPNFLMHHDIVYVTIGYRLNIFGFLNLNMEECSGNQGLKDVVMAFQWIRENIHVFNGDPNNITVVGSSGGAMLVHLLLLSPSVKGLFDKAIMMGLYAFNCLIPHCQDQTARAFEFARELGFKGNDPQKLLRFLKRMPAEKLTYSIMNYQAKLDKYTLKSYIGGPFNESIDSVLIPETPRKLIPTMERVPVLFGICDKEAICGFIQGEEETFEKNCHNVYRQGPWGWPYSLTDNELDELNKQIHSFYFETLPENVTHYAQQVNICTDAAFSEVYDTLIDPIAKLYAVYVYKFRYAGEISMLRRRCLQDLKEPLDGSYHCDDVSYWAHQITPEKRKTRWVIDTFTKLLCSFAKTGDPNHEDLELYWKPSTLEHPCYLEIDEKLTLIDGKLNGERFKFWDSLKSQFKHD